MRPCNERERQIVKDDILFWHEKRWRVHVLTVMPNHVHLLATLMEQGPGVWFALPDILHSVKRGSALKMNRLRGSQGPLWQTESFDRIVRDEREFNQKALYILSNAVKAGLAADAWRWDGFWCEGMPSSRAGSKPAQTLPPQPSVRGIPADVLIVKRRRKLPHWQLGGSTYFVTFRLRE